MVIAGLVVVLLLVLTLPFVIKKIEENLEPFLFIMGISACLISGIMSVKLVLKALEEPIMITLAVFIAGAVFHLLHEKFQLLMNHILKHVPLPIVVFLVIVILGLISSLITAIIASIILVEVIFLLPLKRKQKIVVCVIACFSIGLGAALTPIGEPLATIAISKLGEEFLYLYHLLSIYIIPSIVVYGIIGSLYIARAMKTPTTVETADDDTEDELKEQDSWSSIIVRALKVYLFVMALVFLGEGFQPLIDKYVLGLSPNLLYWVNMISAVLDNATLTAAEISRQMNDIQVRAIIMGLLINGGMLIPGNIPNIISASKLKISSKEWAMLGVPLGLVTMALLYLLIF
ncbi:MAG: DUF1646 family protein [Syntrophomonadaceae bacterium]